MMKYSKSLGVVVSIPYLVLLHCAHYGTFYRGIIITLPAASLHMQESEILCRLQVVGNKSLAKLGRLNILQLLSFLNRQFWTKWQILL